MSDLETTIKVRIGALEQERDQIVSQANTMITAINRAIAELQNLVIRHEEESHEPASNGLQLSGQNAEQMAEVNGAA